MSWEKTSQPKPEELDASAQAQRDQVIENYRNTLEDLENQIKEAHNNLQYILQDISRIHEDRVKQYKDLENTIKSEQDRLSNLIAHQEDSNKELEHKKQSFDLYVSGELKSLSDKALALSAQDDQLRAQKDEQAKIQQDLNNRSASQARIHDDLKLRAAELDQFKVDADKVSNDLIDKHHKLQEQVAFHAINVQTHMENVSILHDAENKNRLFYDALIEREAAIEPLKAKYEEGLATNEKEAKRLKDANIESYKIANDAEKRLNISIEAEQRAKTEIEKLEALKNEIHASIKKEN